MNDNLKQLLEADMGDNDLLAIVRQINALPRPEPSLEPARLARAISEQPRWWEWYALLLLQSQLRVVAKGIFLASALVLILGAVVTMSFQDGQSSQLPIVVVAPIVAAIGIAALYEGEQAYELEVAAPTGFTQLLLARMSMVFGFDLVIALACSIGLSISMSSLSLMVLVQAWLIPMTFVSAFSFFVTVLSNNAIIGVLSSLAIWMSHVIWYSSTSTHWVRQWLAFEWLATSDVLVLIVSGTFLTVALWLLHRDEGRPVTL